MTVGTQYLKNKYTCEKCGAAFVTIDRDRGVTPFMARCAVDECGGLAESSLYRINQNAAPTHEWYRPDEKQKAGLKPHFLDHVNNGGLLLRKIPDDPIPVENPIFGKFLAGERR